MTKDLEKKGILKVNQYSDFLRLVMYTKSVSKELKVSNESIEYAVDGQKLDITDFINEIIQSEQSRIIRYLEGEKKVSNTGCGICSRCHNEEVCIDRKLEDAHNQALEDIKSFIKGK